jgi:inorganic pyrophosphatase/exopolyphosphatase
LDSVIFTEEVALPLSIHIQVAKTTNEIEKNSNNKKTMVEKNEHTGFSNDANISRVIDHH